MPPQTTVHRRCLCSEFDSSYVSRGIFFFFWGFPTLRTIRRHTRVDGPRSVFREFSGCSCGTWRIRERERNSGKKTQPKRIGYVGPHAKRETPQSFDTNIRIYIDTIAYVYTGVYYRGEVFSVNCDSVRFFSACRSPIRTRALSFEGSYAQRNTARGRARYVRIDLDRLFIRARVTYKYIYINI